MARYLIDLSAWARSGHPEARDRWADMVNGDALVCHPVFAIELLHSPVGPLEYRELRDELETVFEWAWPDAETDRVALRLQQRLATAVPAGQRVKTAGLLTAALAVQVDLGVLHYDRDYDAISEGGGESLRSEWLAPRGTLESAAVAGVNARKVYRKAFGERMMQLTGGVDLGVWPELIGWLDGQLKSRGLDLPPPVDHD